MIWMKQWTISYKPLSQIWDSLKILVSCNLPIIYTSLCTEKITSWFQKYCCIQCCILKNISDLHLQSARTLCSSFLREAATWGYVLKVGTELCMSFMCSSDYVQSKQNYIWVSKYEAKHTHDIYKYLNTCNKNKRQVNMSTTLTVISLAQGLA